jgi:hypothetical protein
MIPVLATVPADVVLRTINFQDDYSFFLFLVGVHRSTIRPTDLRLFASKSVAQQRILSYDIAFTDQRDAGVVAQVADYVRVVIRRQSFYDNSGTPDAARYQFLNSVGPAIGPEDGREWLNRVKGE